MGQKRSSTKKRTIGDKIAMALLVVLPMALVSMLLYLLVVNFVPLYSVGECAAKTDKAEESWQKDETDILKIVRVGNSNYRAVFVRSDDYPNLVGMETDREFGTLQMLYSSAECPGESK